ncbi:MAG TPA: thioredoxin domain-containing protein [Anaeromyxobacteraceae bacterium]|nr:thioredoxin domain-containing protein [Anaeromyxobacteraceae bacterium]
MPSLLAVAAVLTMACQSSRSQPAPAVSDPQKLDPATPMARVNGQTITAAEVDELARRELKQLQQAFQEKAYDVRNQQLEGLIRKRLLEKKAKELGTTPEELLQKEVVAKIPDPTDAEMQALYERAKAGGQQLPPLDQVKPDIAKFIRQQRTQQAMTDYYDQLKKDAKVQILFEAPKVEVAAEGPAKGPAKAPITIVEFSDFQCPYCVRAEGTVKDLLAAYPDKIRLVYRDYPLPFHQNAEKAAEAAHCANDQGKYWEMHDKLFSSQERLAVPDLKGYARELGLDGAKFDHCLDGNDKAKLVESNKKAGEEAGVNGTPAFFINGRVLSGALPLEKFKEVVDSELARK